MPQVNLDITTLQCTEIKMDITVNVMDNYYSITE